MEALVRDKGAASQCSDCEVRPAAQGQAAVAPGCRVPVAARWSGRERGLEGNAYALETKALANVPLVRTDRLPKVRQWLHRAAECQRGIDGWNKVSTGMGSMAIKDATEHATVRRARNNL
ncbi:hypothetical protein HaLaN_18102 [Haematococcus lacustris]|uniref:Uncharacterized protein n=1 Tax=Haematococcus lacustris TaxID=44745 RepID=A0A699ZDW3_HAELA|nr:hypothetical protein HaLaN_18102 [Haematococcus lacustris]